MRRTLTLTCATIMLVAGCTHSVTSDTQGMVSPTRSAGRSTYHDPAGWSVDVPPRWSVVSFSTSFGDAMAHGALISNVILPSPKIAPGYPIQTTDRDLPPDGIALVVSVDDDPSDVQQPPPSPSSPPITLDDFTEGSASAGAPTLDLLWFSGNGQVLIATIKTGPNARSADLESLASIVSSLRID